MIPTKTGTTIVGVTYTNGVIICADTRSTSGPIVANKNCQKIHFITPKIWCCGAGTAADTGRVTRMASKELQLFSYRHMKDPYMSHCQRFICDHLHSYGGAIEAALILGGIDAFGPSLYSISPNGYSYKMDYTSLGSGSYAAIAVLEAKFKKGMTKEEAISLACDAVKAGILNDLYSGSNVDVCIIDANGIENLRNHLVIEKSRNDTEIAYPMGSVEVLKEDIYKYVEEVK